MTENHIELRNISFSFEKQRPLLEELSLSVRYGEKILITGDNGTGKTTLLHLVVGLLKPLSGEIQAFGRTRIAEKDFHEVRARAGLLFQNPDDQLFCSTVIEDIAFGPLNLGLSRKDAKELASETLKTLGMEGYEEKITYNLSFGEKKIISLATVFAMNPDVMLLDEPASGLDSKHLEKLAAFLKNTEKAIVMVSHNESFGKSICDTVYTLEEHKLSLKHPGG